MNQLTGVDSFINLYRGTGACIYIEGDIPELAKYASKKFGKLVLSILNVLTRSDAYKHFEAWGK